MLRKVGFVVGLGLAMMALVACGGGGGGAAPAPGSPEPTPVGDAANGETLFNSPTIGNAPGCITCHSLEPGVVIVGPSQAGLATRAATRVSGQTAEEYIRNSILNPNDYVVEGFSPGVMFQDYKTDLTPQQIDDIVAFALTLK